MTDQDGAPVSGATIRFSLLHTADFGTATTDDNGAFSARALAGGGTYVYEVSSERSRLVYPPMVGKRFPSIAVRDASDHVSGVVIRVRRDNLVLAGRVVTSAGQPVPDVVVSATTAYRDVTHRGSESTTSSDASGAFSLSELGSGEYTVYARAPNGAEAQQKVAAGTSNLVLTLEDVGEIDGTLDGLAAVFDVVALRDDTQARYPATMTGATFQIRSVPPGRYWVGARSPTQTSSTTVTIAAGTTVNVVLRSTPTGTIVATVLDGKTSAPIADQYCVAQPTGDGGGVEAIAAYRHGITGPDGSVRIEDMPAGDATITCYANSGVAEGEVRVVADQVVRLQLFAIADVSQNVYAGVTFEDQLGELMVKSVAPGGPADRAGIAVGDIVVKVNGEPMNGFSAGLTGDELPWPAGPSVSVTIERDDVEVTVQLVLGKSPPE